MMLYCDPNSSIGALKKGELRTEQSEARRRRLGPKQSVRMSVRLSVRLDSQGTFYDLGHIPAEGLGCRLGNFYEG
jgi:hypothetical protein